MTIMSSESIQKFVKYSLMEIVFRKIEKFAFKKRKKQTPDTKAHLM